MSEVALSTTIESPQDAPDNSTVVQDDGDHNPAPQHKPSDMDDAISKALDEAEAKDDPKNKVPEPKRDEKEDKPAKKEPEPDASEDDPEGDDAAEDDKAEKPKEGLSKEEKDERARQKQREQAIADAPKGFVSPTAKEKWANVPHEVRGEVNRVLKEAEEFQARAKQQNERYERIKDFDELAQRNGRDLRDSLMRVHRIENELQSNPVAGLNRILMEAGPRKADGSPISIREFAQAIARMDDNTYNNYVRQPQQQKQQQQINPEVEQLRAQLSQMQQQQIMQSVIEPFKSENPRYTELEPAIAQILKSGMIPDSVSGKERLAMAYDMAVRLNPASHIEPEEDDKPATESNSNRAVSNFGGSRSIKGSPPSGGDGAKPKRKVMSRDQAINAAMAALR